jgi:hypothetical protein
MVRGGRSDAGHRGGKGIERHNIRGSRDSPWDPMNPEDDSLHDLRPHDDDQHDPVNDEYVWPEFTDEDED